MKPVRLIALGLIGVFVARQYKLSSQGTGSQPSPANHAQPTAPAKRQPQHTPVSATALTNNTSKA